MGLPLTYLLCDDPCVSSWRGAAQRAAAHRAHVLQRHVVVLQHLRDGVVDHQVHHLKLRLSASAGRLRTQRARLRVRVERLEGDLQRRPGVLDLEQRLLDDQLLLRALDRLGDDVHAEVQVQREHAAQAELVVQRENLAGGAHELLPVALAHAGVVQVGDERQRRLQRLKLLLQLAVALEAANSLGQRLHLPASDG
jgi:hypothetical protein